VVDTLSDSNSTSIYRQRVLVKFKDGITLPHTDDVDIGAYIEEHQIGPWRKLADDFPGIILRHKFAPASQGELQDLVNRATQMDPTYKAPDFLTYFVIDVPLGLDYTTLAKELSGWDNVEYAYVEAEPAPAPSVSPTDDYRVKDQGYLEAHDPAAPTPTYGVNARYAWSVAGGDGAGITFVDIEQGWYLIHNDLPVPAVSIIAGVDIDSVPDAFLPASIANPTVFKRQQRGHGTNSLGVVAGVDNATGIVGIAPHTLAKVASIWWKREVPAGSGIFEYEVDIANTIRAAIATLQFGDILLLELQLPCSASALPCQSEQYEPVELEPANFDIIRLATALGVVVVEAAGNGSKVQGAFDLNNRLLRGTNQHILDKNSNEFKDSGAILVGAATKAYPHSRLDTNSLACKPMGDPSLPSNFGNRVDCYAWGQCVYTAGQANGLPNAYESFYNSTSSAAAIVAGVAVVVQGVAQQHSLQLSLRLGPLTMRSLLRNATYGTQSMTPGSDLIGVMPELKKIIGQGLGVTPDIYIRDFVGDDGDPHTGAISASPDVIVRPVDSVANPNTAFGGSATFNDSTLGSVVIGGHDHVVYVRVLNRGGSSASGAQATVYWAYPSTLVTPNMWTKIGTSANPINVPISTTSLTVLNPIPWPAAAIPGLGYYCFIATIGSNADPDPIPNAANLMSLTLGEFQNTIRRNNNVTWRNFNVVAMLAGIEMIALPFMAQGWLTEDLPMRLEVVARLPEGSGIWLEGPQEFMKMIVENSFYLEEGGEAGVLRLPINPYGVNRFKEVVFRAKLQADMRVLVDIPKEQRENAYEVFAHQLYHDEEVGRVTWRLTPSDRVTPSRLRFVRDTCSTLRRIPWWAWFFLGVAAAIIAIRSYTGRNKDLAYPVLTDR
jgi:serine protease